MEVCEGHRDTEHAWAETDRRTWRCPAEKQAVCTLHTGSEKAGVFEAVKGSQWFWVWEELGGRGRPKALRWTWA